MSTLNSGQYLDGCSTNIFRILAYFDIEVCQTELRDFCKTRPKDVQELVNGQYMATDPSGEWIFSVTGDENWKDNVIETDFSLGVSGGYDQLAILVRAGGTSTLGLAFLIRPSHGEETQWGVWQERDWAILAIADWERARPGESGHVRIEVKEATFTASVDRRVNSTHYHRQ